MKPVVNPQAVKEERTGDIIFKMPACCFVCVRITPEAPFAEVCEFLQLKKDKESGRYFNHCER